MAEDTRSAADSVRHQYITGQFPYGPSLALSRDAEYRQSLALLERNAKERWIKREQDDHAAKAAADNVHFDPNTVSDFLRENPTGRLPGLGWWPPKRQLERSNLCALCQAIDFKAAFTTPRIPNSSLETGSLGSKQQWHYEYKRGFGWLEKDSSCEICRYLANAVDTTHRPEAGYTLIFHNEDEPGRDNDEVLIRVIPYTRYTPVLGDLKKLRSAWNTIVCHRNRPIRKTGRPQIVSPVFDGLLARSWLDTCKRTHTACALEQGIQIPKTRLINCSTRTLVSARSQTGERHSFVALSYVWGPNEPKETANKSETLESQPSKDCLPNNLPLTIEDAITVAMALGFKYLWVDQYCIDQKDHVDKVGQISQMDLIYKCADLPIIAAAGDDCQSGLPGVSACRRNILNPFVLDGFFTFGIHPREDHQYWKMGSWHTRGWTFQEALLSRRRLVFSDTAMYFECMGYTDGAWQSQLSGGVECANYDPSRIEHDKYHGVSGAGIQSVVGSNNLSTCKMLAFYDNGGQMGPIPRRGLSESFLTYTALVGQYTARRLTYASDGLNAFRGVANALQHLDHPVFNMGGIPFVVADEADDGDSLAVNSFLRGLAWRSPPGSKGLSREFPTWCWANRMEWGVTWTWNQLARYFCWWLYHDNQESELVQVLSEAIYHAHDIIIEFDLEGKKKLHVFADFAKVCRSLTTPSPFKGNPTALCFQSRILNSSFTRQKCGDGINTARGSVHSDLGYEAVEIDIHFDVASSQDQEDNEVSRAHQGHESEITWSTYISDERLYTALASENCGLVLLRFDNNDALALLVEWVTGQQKRHRKTARRVGICRFSYFDGKFGWSDNTPLLRCFAANVDLKLV